MANFRAAENGRRYSYILMSKRIAKKAASTGRLLERRLKDDVAPKDEIGELRPEKDLEPAKVLKPFRLTKRVGHNCMDWYALVFLVQPRIAV